MNTADHREFKDHLFEQFARLGKALASPKRLEIVDLLAQGERTVEEIARETAMSVASASQHLQALKAARMVEARREGLYIHYRLADEDVFRTWQAVRALAESRLAELDGVVEASLQTLPRNQEMVAYCRGPYCVFSDEAVAFLRSRGYRARRLRQGLPDWRAAGVAREGEKGGAKGNKRK